MKNVKFLVKLRRLVKSLAVSIFILSVSIVITACNADANNTDPAAPKKASEGKGGFKSLFSASAFDPSKPYVAQINPQAVPFVQEYIEKRGADLEKMKVWGKPYFDMYDGILSQYGLPKELKYLSVVESSLLPNLVSVAGAAGPWQIMASEAQRMGLKVTSKVDERRNYLKSTHAAAKILKELYSQFNDWILVIAAYNCGQGRMRQAIRKAGSRNFWDLQAFLPLETRNHVKKFIGTHYAFEGNGGLTTMTAAELKNIQAMPEAASKSEATANTSILEISGKYNSLVVASQLEMNFADFNKLNPQFDKVLSAGNSYNLRLPNDKVTAFKKLKHNILNESVQFLLNSGNALSAGS